MKSKTDKNDSDKKEHSSYRQQMSVSSKRNNRSELDGYAFYYEVEVQRMYRRIIKRHEEILFNGFVKSPTIPVCNNVYIGHNDDSMEVKISFPFDDESIKMVQTAHVNEPQSAVFRILDKVGGLYEKNADGFRNKLTDFVDSGKKYMIFPAVQVAIDDTNEFIGTQHANLLLFENTNKKVTCYYFEPQVRLTMIDDALLQMNPMMNLVYNEMKRMQDMRFTAVKNAIRNLGVKFVEPEKLTYNGFSLQDFNTDSLMEVMNSEEDADDPELSTDPFCQAHCMIWLETLLRNPSIEPADIVKYIINKVRIDNYLQFVIDYVKKHKLARQNETV